MVVHKKIAGNHAEQQACDFLQARGMKLIERNYRANYGEIDLIMQDGNDIVFVEVRSRTHDHFGSAIESINSKKQQKILQTAELFLQKKNWLDNKNCRFDVVGVNAGHIEWIEDAFTADIL